MLLKQTFHVLSVCLNIEQRTMETLGFTCQPELVVSVSSLLAEI